MGRWAFETERFIAAPPEPTGSDDPVPDPAFVLNRPPFTEARILVAGENFGCGSSRERAVWAIAGLGIRCVIAPSFGETLAFEVEPLYRRALLDGLDDIGLTLQALPRIEAFQAREHERRPWVGRA